MNYWCLPRHGDSAQTIGAALAAKAAGHGWRTVAARLGRPGATVRRWLRRAGVTTPPGCTAKA
jgi:hypothetical protein